MHWGAFRTWEFPPHVAGVPVVLRHATRALKIYVPEREEVSKSIKKQGKCYRNKGEYRAFLE